MEKRLPESADWRDLKYVELDDIVAYLLHKGWRKIAHHNPRLQVFVYKELDDEREWSYLIALPAHTEFSDVYVRIMDALDRLARIEDTPKYVILQRFVRIERKLAGLNPTEAQRIADELAEVHQTRTMVEHLLTKLAEQEQTIRQQARIIEENLGVVSNGRE